MNVLETPLGHTRSFAMAGEVFHEISVSPSAEKQDAPDTLDTWI